MGLLRGVDDSRLHRHNLEAEGLRTSRSGWGNRWGNETLASAVFPNEINSLGRRFVSHQPPHPASLKIAAKSTACTSGPSPWDKSAAHIESSSKATCLGLPLRSALHSPPAVPALGQIRG